MHAEIQASLTWGFTNSLSQIANWTKRVEHATIQVRKTRESGSDAGFPLLEPMVFIMDDHSFHLGFHGFIHFSTFSE